jgi:uncharacterized protein YaaN involved in tellurite resistance
MVKPLFGGTTTNVVPLPHVAPKPSNAVALKPIDVNEVMNFGNKAAASIPAATTKITSMVKSKDMDEMGALLLDTVSMAKGYDPASMDSKGFFGKLFGKAVNIKDRFATVDKSVQALIAQLDSKSTLFRTRIQDLDAIKTQLEQDYNSLEIEIAEIYRRADWMDANPPQVDLNNPMEVSKLNEWKMAAAMGRKRADDLGRLRLLFEQQAAQVSIMKTNSASLAIDMNDMKSTMIPALQSTFALYIINMEQKNAAEFGSAMKAKTNDAIMKNAALLGQTTTAVTTSLTTSNIELATLQANKDAIVNSLAERERIMTEMKLRLRNEAPQLEQLSRELATTLAK